MHPDWRAVGLRIQAEVDKMIGVMRAVKAHVKGGRLLVDEPTDLPDGAEVELTFVEEEHGQDERARLDAALATSLAQARAGQLLDGDTVIRKLLARR